MTDHDKSQEVDLLYFLRPITTGLTTLWSFFNAWLRELYRRKWVVIGLILAAVAIGYGLRFVLPKSYKSSAVFISYHMKAEFCSGLVNNLGGYLSDENSGSLSKQLNIPIESARSIKSLKAFAQGDNIYLDEKDSSVSLFRVELAVADNKTFPVIEEGVAKMLESNEHIVKRKQARLNYLNAIKADYERRLRGLDSLKKVVNNTIVTRRSEGGLVIDPISPLDIYKTEQDFYQQWLAIQQQLETVNNIGVLQSFVAPDHPNQPDFRKIFMYVVGAVVLLVFIWVAFMVKPARKL